MVDYLQPNHIYQLINYGQKLVKDNAFVQSLINKAMEGKGLTPDEAAILLHIEDQELMDLMIQAAHEIKEKIYGRRIVLFAPLFISNYCVNHCIYCRYKASNQSFQRRKLSSTEVKEEVEGLLSLGHNRIVLEAGEDARECSMDYIIQTIKDINSVKVNTENIRQINVNVAATTVKNYQRLKEAEIGTYILFQETYHKSTYEKFHPRGPKSNFLWHSTTMDRALIGGIEDVGVGVLLGLYDYKYEIIAMLLHANYLEQSHGVGPHTISVPRLKVAENVCLENFPHLVSEIEFKKIVAILRLSVPYAGLILSTSEESDLRDELLALGITQISTMER